MKLASNLVSVANVLRAGTRITADVASRRYVMLDANGVGYVLRKGKFCPIVGVDPSGLAVTIETVTGALPETAPLKRAADPAKPAPAQPKAAPKGAAANAPAKGSPEAKARMAELRAKQRDPAKPSTLDAISQALASVAETQARMAVRMDAQEAAFAAFVSQFAPKAKRKSA